MNNGIRVTVTSDHIMTLTMFLDDKDKTWIEFDKEQAEGLITLLREKIALLDNKEST